MTISAADVRHIAGLARLELSDEEVERFRAELAAILEYVARLEALEAEPTSADRPVGGPTPSRVPVRDREHMFAIANKTGLPALREDVVLPYADPARLHAAAPRFADGFFLVPRVVE